MFNIKRFLTCRRGAVALESALAALPLMLCLAGVFEIVQTIFAGDLLQRAAHNVARTNAMAGEVASNSAAMTTRVQDAIEEEIGDWLSYDLQMNAACPEPGEGEEDPPTEYCLSAAVEIYGSPDDMLSGTPSVQSDAVGFGGGSNDMVVVRLQLQSRSVLGDLKQTLFGESGLQAVAVSRNEEHVAG